MAGGRETYASHEVRRIRLRKKSHISVAKMIVRNVEHEELRHHWKAFYLGSVLPDCRPSFLTKRHEYNGTFEETAEEIRLLSGEEAEQDNNSVNSGPKRGSAAYFRKLGEVLHFVADYFTFPHNQEYEGNLRDHCRYEKHLKNYLREYIESGRAARQERRIRIFRNVEEILTFITTAHREYVSRRRSVEEDARYIIHLCQQVAYGILQLTGRNGNAEELRIS